MAYIENGINPGNYCKIRLGFFSLLISKKMSLDNEAMNYQFVSIKFLTNFLHVVLEERNLLNPALNLLGLRFKCYKPSENFVSPLEINKSNYPNSIGLFLFYQINNKL